MVIKHELSVHLWIFNHPFNGISDQVAFFISVFRQHGYSVSVGYQPKDSALNVVIENFSAQTRDILTSFCQSRRKRVAVIMTEHLDFEQRQIFIHGTSIWNSNENDYMHPATQLGRIRYLMDSFPYIRCFFILGDLPELKNISEMLPGIAVRTLPFPKFEIAADCHGNSITSMDSDLLFTGFMTEYRSRICELLEASGFSIKCTREFVSQKKRNSMNRSSRVILNIPQRADWRWLSLMRIIAALRCGRATVSLGTHDSSRISACTYQLDMNDPEWIEILREYIGNWSELYQRAYDSYISMANEYERKNRFPHDMIEYWAITDHIFQAR